MNVIKLRQQGIKVNPIDYIAMYTTIDRYKQSVEEEEIKINIKCKLVDRKVKSMPPYQELAHDK